MSDAKSSFQKAKELVSQQQNSALFHLVEGLTLLSDQITNMDYRLRQMESDLKELKKN